MQHAMAPPVANRDANLTAAFLEAAGWLAKKNVVYALHEYLRLVARAMGPRWLSPDDLKDVTKMKRWDPERVFVALAGQLWMPAKVRAMAADPAGSLQRLSARAPIFA